MNKLSSGAFTGVKYLYLVVFFVLLAGFFHPVITGTSPNSVIAGTLILLMGLGGGILVYRAVTVNKRRVAFMGAGFGLIAISLAAIMQLAN